MGQAVKVGVKVDGLKEVIKALDSMGLDPPTSTIWKARWKEVANPIAASARSIVPARTGRTARSVRARSSKVSAALLMGGNAKPLKGVRRWYFGADTSINPVLARGWWTLHDTLDKYQTKINTEIEDILDDMIRSAGLDE